MTDAPETGREARVEPDGSELTIGPESGFRCPLRGDCFAEARPPYSDTRTANDAVRAYQNITSPAPRARAGNDLFLRHLPLVRKTLQRFCGSARCFAGGCVVEDLVGESYAIFRRALDEYDPERGVDFLGFVSQRLYWASRHRLRELHRTTPSQVEAGALHPEGDTGETERVLLRSIWLAQLLARLTEADAEALRYRFADGCSCGEVAERLAVSPAAARKRLERARGRLRQLAQASEA